MNTTQTSFLIVDCSKGLNTALPMARAGERSGVILHATAIANESFEQATRRLLRLCELAHGARDYDALRELSAALQSIPFAPAQGAATYYAAIIAKRAGDFERAADLLSTLDVPRAIQTLGTIYQAQGDQTEAARLYIEALRRAREVDALAVINAAIQLSAIKSSAGDHTAALLDLESLWPMVRIVARAHPHRFFQFHNEMAVELAAVGNTEAARRAADVAMSAPIAEQYPEWQETAAELRECERVAVVVVAPQSADKRQRASFILPLITHQRSAFGTPWAGLLERVKLCARDRDGPFVNVK